MPDLAGRLARNVLALRVPHGFASLEKLASAAGFSRAQLYAILQRGCDPSIDRVAQLGGAFGLPPSTLLRPSVAARISGILNTDGAASIQNRSSAALGADRSRWEP